MNIFRLALELFVIYMLYKLIFDFIIPVYRTTRQMRQKMTEMHKKMQEEQELQNHSYNNSTARQQDAPKKAFSDDYIEYEEVK